MSYKVVIAFAAAALAASTFVSQPASAGTCAVLTESAIGVKQSDAAERAQRQLSRKIDRWADKNGYKYVKSSKSSTSCNKQGGIAVCTATAKVCG